MIKKHYFRTWNLAKVWATLRQVGTPGFFSGLLSDLNMPEKTELKEIGGAVLSFALSNLFHWLMNVISLYIQQYASALVFVYLSKLSQCITNDACFFLVLIHRHDNNRLSKKVTILFFIIVERVYSVEEHISKWPTRHVFSGHTNAKTMV